MAGEQPQDAAGHKPTLYLAGPVQHADDHGVSWRETAAETAHSFETADPLDKYNVGLDDLEIVHGGESGEGEVTPAEIVHNDKRLIDESDAILVGFDNVRWRSCMRSIHRSRSCYGSATKPSPKICRRGGTTTSARSRGR